MNTKEVDVADATGSHTEKDHCCDAATSSSQDQTVAVGNGMAFRIDTMDCAAEESEIRRALAPVSGVRGLSFQLGARTVTIDAPEQVIPEALIAIREAGFDPQPAATVNAGVIAEPLASRGLWRLGIALALAIAAEILDFFAPETMLFQGIGMALAVAAIALAGISTYRKGLAALRRARAKAAAFRARGSRVQALAEAPPAPSPSCRLPR